MDLQLIKSRFFPDFYQENAPKLIEFFSIFLNFLNQKDNASNIVGNLLNNHDIDLAIEEFLKTKSSEILVNFPTNISSNIRILLKNLLKFYISRGSVDSYNFIFKTLYNADVSISYPGQSILRASDGKWVQPTYIKIKENITDIEYNDLMHTKAIGLTSGAVGYVTNIAPYQYSGDSVAAISIVIDTTIIPYTPNETVEFISESYSARFINKYFTVDKSEKSSGTWTNTDGMLSMDKVLQDSYFYQDFSYLLSSTVPIEEYRNIITQLVHPAGFIMFGNAIYYSDSDVSLAPLTEIIRYWIIAWEYILTVGGITITNPHEIHWSIIKEVQDVLYPDANTSIVTDTINKKYFLNNEIQDYDLFEKIKYTTINLLINNFQYITKPNIIKKEEKTVSKSMDYFFINDNEIFIEENKLFDMTAAEIDLDKNISSFLYFDSDGKNIIPSNVKIDRNMYINNNSKYFDIIKLDAADTLYNFNYYSGPIKLEVHEYSSKNNILAFKNNKKIHNDNIFYNTNNITIQNTDYYDTDFVIYIIKNIFQYNSATYIDRNHFTIKNIKNKDNILIFINGIYINNNYFEIDINTNQITINYNMNINDNIEFYLFESNEIFRKQRIINSKYINIHNIKPTKIIF